MVLLALTISNSPCTLLEDRFITNSAGSSSWSWNLTAFSTNLLQHSAPTLRCAWVMLWCRGLHRESALDWFYNSLVCSLLWPGESPMLGWLLGWVCAPCSSSWCCCEPCHHLSCSLNLHSSLQCLLNLSHEDLFGFPGFEQSIIQSKNWAFFLWECALDGHLTQIHPAVPLCALALVYGSTFLSIFQFFPWVAKAVSVISCGSPAGPSAEGPEEHSALELRAFGSHRGREESCSAQSQPKPHPRACWVFLCQSCSQRCLLSMGSWSQKVLVPQQHTSLALGPLCQHLVPWPFMLSRKSWGGTVASAVMP